MKSLLIASLLSITLFGCSAEIGSEEWCNDLKEKEKGEWTANEVKDYTKHCLFK